jgi:hypothetical protein
MAKVRKRRSTASPPPADKSRPSLTLELPPEQAEALQKLLPPPEALRKYALPPGATRTFSLPPELAEGLRKLALSSEQAEALHKLVFQPKPAEALRKYALPPGAEQELSLHLAIRDGLLPPSWSEETQVAKELPTSRPQGIGPKVWLAANVVLALSREGYKWGDREMLRRKVEERTRVKLSLATLKKAIRYLKKRKLIDY